MTLLDATKDADGEYQASSAGTVAFLADTLFDEFAIMGYAIQPSDIATALINDLRFYAAWESTEQQKKARPELLGSQYLVSLHEWGIIEPVIRAHCEYMQAQLMEASASLGTERFGLSVAEAKPAYDLAKEEMKKNAFVQESFVI